MRRAKADDDSVLSDDAPAEKGSRRTSLSSKAAPRKRKREPENEDESEQEEEQDDEIEAGYDSTDDDDIVKGKFAIKDKDPAVVAAKPKKVKAQGMDELTQFLTGVVRSAMIEIEQDELEQLLNILRKERITSTGLTRN